MFWKIIFYIWLFCTVFNIGNCFCIDAKLIRKYGKDALQKGSLFERFWSLIRLIVACALPIFNFTLFMYLFFNFEEFYNKCKQRTEKEIAERKENNNA